MRRLNIAALIVAVVLVAAGFTYQARERVTWEYKFVQMKLDFKKTEIALSDLGAQGWEVIAVTDDGGIANFYLKRSRP